MAAAADGGRGARPETGSAREPAGSYSNKVLMVARYRW